MKIITNEMRAILKNNVLFYIFVAISLIYIFYLVWLRDTNALLVYLLAGLITYFISNNTIIILCVSLIALNIYLYITYSNSPTSEKEGLCVNDNELARATTAFDKWSKDRDAFLRTQTRDLKKQRHEEDQNSKEAYNQQKLLMQKKFREIILTGANADEAYAEWEKDADAKFNQQLDTLKVNRNEADRQKRFDDTQYRLQIKNQMQKDFCQTKSMNYDGPIFQKDPALVSQVQQEKKRIADEFNKMQEETKRVAEQAKQAAIDEANRVANEANRVANEAKNIKNKAADEAVNIKNKAADETKKVGNSFRKAFRF